MPLEEGRFARAAGRGWLAAGAAAFVTRRAGEGLVASGEVADRAGRLAARSASTPCWGRASLGTASLDSTGERRGCGGAGDGGGAYAGGGEYAGGGGYAGV